MSLQIHRAERADRLARALGEILLTPLPDPFVGEVVAVPTQGVERWLAQSLSHRLGTSTAGRDGICAGVEFPSLRRLTASAVAQASGVELRTDPWQPRHAVWPLLTVIDEAHGQDWASLLLSYLGEPAAGLPAPPDGHDLVRQGRRWSTAQHLAELFADYGASRPDMVLSWLDGRDVDAAGRQLPSDYRWQAELWRRLRAAIGTPSPAERTDEACRRLVADPEVSSLPARVSVFGATRLSPENRVVLAALAEHREVHLWLPHASPALWRKVSDSIDGTAELGPRTTDRSVALPANPLLGYLGRDIRELQLTLTAVSVPAVDLHHAGPETDETDETAGQPALSLLQRLQDDLSHDRAIRPEAERPVLDEGDHSVAVHASHGPDRQVEVLRELLVGLLADDPTLEPRDIVVMCPDIERFAPLISASFGQVHDDVAAEHPGHRLRVRLADRSLRQINPLLAALSRVLALAGSRMEAATLLDLCAFAPVARKFAFSDDDLERLADLVTRSGVRWGLDATHREAYAMGLFPQNTWAAGLERLLLGVTMDESGQQFIGTALPLDDVDSSDVELVGRLAELVERLRWFLRESDGRRRLGEWITLCQQTIQAFTSVSGTDSWQEAHAYAELGALTRTATHADGVAEGSDEPTLSLHELEALLAETFRGRATRANFRTGTLTMCTMLPMRSVPHRVICLLGVDDGVFPRRLSRDGDDILAAEPWVGDRDPRSEDRQLLLDAIMAAEEHLLVIYSGADARTRAPKPPAVPIGALLDQLDVTARTRTGGRVRDQILTTHPLQPFDPDNFRPGGLGSTSETDTVFSFDRGSLQGARAARRPRRPAAPLYSVERLPEPVIPDEVELADLVRFFNHPVKALLRERAGLYARADEDEQPDQIPVQLHGLEAWAIGDRLLDLHLDGTDLDQLKAAEWRRGTLPPRSFGRQALNTVVDKVVQVAQASSPYLAEERSSVDLLVELGAGRSVSGTLSSVYGEHLVHVNYSWVGAKHRLQSWIELLALTAHDPEHSWRAVTIGRGKSSILGPVPATWAGTILADLVDLHRTGLCEPLPLGPKIAAEYARIRYDEKSIANFSDRLDQLWAEERDLAYERFFGTGVRFATLLDPPSVPAEERGSLAEPSRFGTLARRVWQPLLASEMLT